MTWKPVPKTFLVEQDKAVEKTEQGIELPEHSRIRPREGTVVAIGDDLPSYLHVGSRVKWVYNLAEAEIDIDDRKLLVMAMNDIAVVKTDE